MAIFNSPIGQIIEKAGSHRIVAIKPAKSLRGSLRMVQGVRFDCGYYSPHLSAESATVNLVLENPYILVASQLHSVPKLKRILSEIRLEHRRLLIITQDVDNDVLTALSSIEESGGVAPVVVRNRYSRERANLLTEYIAGLAGQHGREYGITLDQLGGAEWVVLQENHCTIINGKGIDAKVQSRVEQLRTNPELSKLPNGAAVIEVGGITAGRKLKLLSLFEQALTASDHLVYEVTEGAVSARPVSPASPPKRYMNVLFTEGGESRTTVPRDQPLLATRTYKLVVDVNPERYGLSEHDVEWPDEALDKCWDKTNAIMVLVAASSKDFRIDSPIQHMELPREGPSRPVFFTVTPDLQSGEGFIQVELFYRGNLLQSKRIEASIVPDAISRNNHSPNWHKLPAPFLRLPRS
jgi:hypothetical protein